MMRWSPQQSRALDLVARWLKDPHAPQVFYLAGYAGTGKTTLARYLAEDVGRVLFAAFTGKAAYVLRRKGCPGASTIHRLIYQTRKQGREGLVEVNLRIQELERMLWEPASQEEEDATKRIGRELRELRQTAREIEEAVGRPFFVLNPMSELRHADLAVVDECSMVDERIGRDVESFGTKVLVLGDPAQLPPVGSGGYWTSREPDFLLTEIHRQAADSPVLQLATMIRQGERPALGTYGTSRVVRSTEPEEAVAVDQLLVGRNKTRHWANRRLRKLLLGQEHWEPVESDRLVCLRNDHEQGLLNGSLWSAQAVEYDDAADQLHMELHGEDGEERHVSAHPHHFRGDAQDLGWARMDAQEFDYGYALTTHKAQGSQWDSVLVLDESRVFRHNAQRWLYTAVTRASERVVIVDNRR